MTWKCTIDTVGILKFQPLCCTNRQYPLSFCQPPFSNALPFVSIVMVWHCLALCCHHNCFPALYLIQYTDRINHKQPEFVESSNTLQEAWISEELFLTILCCLYIVVASSRLTNYHLRHQF